jgi:hypothetical protein
MVVVTARLVWPEKCYEQQYRDSPLCQDNETTARTRFADTCRNGSNEESR